jgi:hypothetical protein
VVRRPADGSGAAEALPMPPRELNDVIWSKDGEWLVGGMSGPPNDDLVALRVGVDTAWSVLVQGTANEFEPMISPDGRWPRLRRIRQAEVYVRPFRTPRAASGRSPRMAASTRCGGPAVATCTTSFDGNGSCASLAGAKRRGRTLEVRIPEGRASQSAQPPDGRVRRQQRFLMINQTGQGDVTGDMVFVQNILAELRQGGTVRR